jgi:protein TonB
MFQQLLESNVVRRPRLGGSLVSTIAHAALIAGLVALTATARTHPIEQPEVRVPFVKVATPPSTPQAAAPRTSGGRPSFTSSLAPSTPPLIINAVILDGLPPIDFTRSVVGDQDFARTRPAGGTPDGIVGGTGLSDPNGAWSAEQVDRPVILAPGSPAPAYPDALRAAGIAGSVMMEFVVDTAGRVESGSPRVLTTDHEAFSASVRAVLSRLRFLPAEAQGRKVRQLVRLPFRFDLQSR